MKILGYCLAICFFAGCVMQPEVRANYVVVRDASQVRGCQYINKFKMEMNASGPQKHVVSSKDKGSQRASRQAIVAGANTIYVMEELPLAQNEVIAYRCSPIPS